ncbi:MAG: NADH-quinone oxidoreductase subunit J [Pseudomonadota bacterium]
MVQALAFYLFAFVAVASAMMVITSKNPVHSVLFLILAFFNAAGLFVLMGAEFLAMILVVVYVGAVAVLFLFVVMMLDVNFAQLREGFTRYLPIGGAIGVALLAELIIVGAAWTVGPTPVAAVTATPDDVTNAEAIGRLLYDDYVYLFQASGLVLLVAMVGAIVLTLRQREGVKRQNVSAQIARDSKRAVRLVKARPRTGV